MATKARRARRCTVCGEPLGESDLFRGRCVRCRVAIARYADRFASEDGEAELEALRDRIEVAAARFAVAVGAESLTRRATLAQDRRSDNG